MLCVFIYAMWTITHAYGAAKQAASFHYQLSGEIWLNIVPFWQSNHLMSLEGAVYYSLMHCWILKVVILCSQHKSLINGLPLILTNSPSRISWLFHCIFHKWDWWCTILDFLLLHLTTDDSFRVLSGWPASSWYLVSVSMV